MQKFLKPCLAAILALLLGLPLRAAEIILAAPITVDLITHSSVRVSGTIPSGDAGSTRKIYWDTTANFVANGTLANYTTDGATWSGATSQVVSGLVAGTPYTFCLYLTHGADASNCTNTGNSNSRGTGTTSTLPSPHPALPQSPASWNSDKPASFATTLTVATNCSDFASKVSTAFGSTAGNVKVVVPSDRHVTGGAGTCVDPNLPSTNTGGGIVVIATDDEANLSAPSCTDAQMALTWPTTSPLSGSCPDVSAADEASGYLVTLRASSTTTSALLIPTGTLNVRFVGFRFAPALGPSAGNPKIQQDMVRGDGSGVVFDRSMFDCIGYPYRVQQSYYGGGSNIAFLQSNFNRCEIWKPWATTITSTHATQATWASTGSFFLGRGNQVDTVAPFTVVLNGATGTGHMVVYEEPGGAVTLKYDTGSPISSCTGITCTLDASLTIPADGTSFVYESQNVRLQFPYTNGKFLDGSSNAEPGVWTNQPISLLACKDPTGCSGGGSASSEWESNGPAIDSGTHDITAQNWKIYNSFIGVTGFDFFAQGSTVETCNSGASFCMLIHDIDIQGNTFQSNDLGMLNSAPDAMANPYALSRRQHIELKNGYNVRIAYNTFQNGWSDVGGNTAAAISIKRDYALDPLGIGNRTGDIDIENNTFLHEPSCIYIAGDTDSNTSSPYFGMISRVAIKNNLCRTDGTARTTWTMAADPTINPNAGFGVYLGQTSEDDTIRHNTFDLRGIAPAVLVRTDQWGDGLDFRDNVVIIHKGFATYQGIAALDTVLWPTPSSPGSGVATGHDGTDALAANYLNGTYALTNNLFVFGCNDASSAAACSDSTASGSLLTGISSRYAPGSNLFIDNSNCASCTWGARQDAAGLTNRAGGTRSSFYLTTGPGVGAASDGGNIGIFDPVASVGVRLPGSARVYAGAR